MNLNEIIVKCPKCKTQIEINEKIIGSIKEGLEEENKRNLNQRIEEEKKKMWPIAKQKAKEQIETESIAKIKFLGHELEEKEKKLEEARKAELEIRKEKSRLEDEKKAFELEKERQLDKERERIKEETIKSYEEDHKYKDAEKNKVIADMRKQIEDLKRSSDIKSQQLQGEVLELDLEKALEIEFPQDKIEPVSKGIRGADIIQEVRNKLGRPVGIIVWELKRTQAWSETWIAKLKEDTRKIKGDIAILVSENLPKEVHNFDTKDGIYITKPRSALSIGKIMRLSLLKIASLKSLEAGRTEKKDIIYDYLCGSEFKSRIESVVEATIDEKEILEKERRAFTKIWAAREKQIKKIEDGMIGMYGDLQGIAGKSLPEIKNLMLSSGDRELDEIEKESNIKLGI